MRSISTTSIPAERSKPVEAEGYRFMLLMINVDNDYIDGLTKDLAAECPDGRVEGILTKQEDIMYFPLIAHAVRVTATGFCVDPTAAPEVPAEEDAPEAPAEEDAPEAPAEEDAPEAATPPEEAKK